MKDTVIFIMKIILWVVLVGAFISGWKVNRKGWLNQRTRWVEESIDYDSYVWVCERCEFTTQFDCDGPEEHEYNFCPRCGREIVEYVKYVDPMDEWREAGIR